LSISPAKSSAKSLGNGLVCRARSSDAAATSAQPAQHVPIDTLLPRFAVALQFVPVWTVRKPRGKAGLSLLDGPAGSRNWRHN